VLNRVKSFYAPTIALPDFVCDCGAHLRYRMPFWRTDAAEPHESDYFGGDQHEGRS